MLVLEGFLNVLLLPPISQWQEAVLQFLVLPEIALKNSIASAKPARGSSLFQITRVC